MGVLLQHAHCPDFLSLDIWNLLCGLGGSVAEWLACRTQALKGLGSNRSRDAVG